MFPETSVIKTTRKERQLEDEIDHLNCRIVQLERLSLEVLELHQVSYKVDQYIIPIGDPMKQLVGSGI